MRYNVIFMLAYVASYMLVALGIFNLILAVYAAYLLTLVE